jgi:DHA1 family inner membrane transport protein
MIAPASPATTTSASKLVLAALCVAAFLAALNFFATGPFYPQMAEDLDTTAPLLGQAVTLMTLISAVLGLVVGPLADRSGYRRLLVIGLAAIAVNLVGIALAPTYPVLLALAIVGALGDALVFGLSIALATYLFEGDARRRAISWTIAALSVGAILGVPLLTTIGEFAGWRVAIGAAGIATVAATWFVAAVLPGDQHHPGTPFRLSDLRIAYVPLLAHPPVLRLLGVTVLRALWFLGMLTYIGAYLGDELGLETSEVGLYYLLGGTGASIGNILGGTRIVAASPRMVIAMVNVAGGIVIGLELIATPPVIVLLVPLGALLSGMASVSSTSLLAVESPAGAGTTMALNASLLNAGGAIGAAVGGILLAIGGYGAMALGLPVFAMLAAALVLWPPRPARD